MSKFREALEQANDAARRPSPDRLMKRPEVCEILDVSETLLIGTTIPKVKIGNMVRYVYRDVLAWMNQKSRSLTGVGQVTLPEKYLSPEKTQALLGISRASLASLRRSRNLPFYALSIKTIRYDPREIEAFIQWSTQK